MIGLIQPQSGKLHVSYLEKVAQRCHQQNGTNDVATSMRRHFGSDLLAAGQFRHQR